MPLGKDGAGRTRGPSRAQRAENARQVARAPLRRVVVAGEGWGVDAGRSRYADVDVLECGHVLSGARDLIGRRWPARRRCRKCLQERAPELTREQLAEIAGEGDSG